MIKYLDISFVISNRCWLKCSSKDATVRRLYSPRPKKGFRYKLWPFTDHWLAITQTVRYNYFLLLNHTKLSDLTTKWNRYTLYARTIYIHINGMRHIGGRFKSQPEILRQSKLDSSSPTVVDFKTLIYSHIMDLKLSSLLLWIMTTVVC